ncbi:conjugal transfer protein TrbL, partial [Xanthomonas vasicola pv. vasculorum]|nr:conjugal transfer protein TrbL [Xanthomonas vasicola pv. vasculorum]
MDFLSGLGNYAFFSLINDFLRDEIDIFQWTLLQRTSA